MVNNKIKFFLVCLSVTLTLLFSCENETKSEKIIHSAFSVSLPETWVLMDVDTLTNTGFFNIENKKINESGILTLTYTKDPILAINYLNSMKKEIEENPIFKMGKIQFEAPQMLKNGSIAGEAVEYSANLQGLKVAGIIFVSTCKPYSYCCMYQQNKNSGLNQHFNAILDGFTCR